MPTTGLFLENQSTSGSFDLLIAIVEGRSHAGAEAAGAYRRRNRPGHGVVGGCVCGGGTAPPPPPRGGGARRPPQTKGVGAALHPCAAASRAAMISPTVIGCCPASPRCLRMRCTDSVMLSQEPPSGV